MEAGVWHDFRVGRPPRTRSRDGCLDGKSMQARGQTTDAPDHQVASFEFENFTAVWEHRRFAGNNAEKGENVGCYFYGTKGTFHMAWRQGWTFYPSGML